MTFTDHGMTYEEAIRYPSTAQLQKQASELDVGQQIDVEGPGQKAFTIFAESTHGRRSYRVVRHVPGKGQSRRYVDERRHFKTGGDSTFADSVALAYEWMGIDSVVIACAHEYGEGFFASDPA